MLASKGGISTPYSVAAPQLHFLSWLSFSRILILIDLCPLIYKEKIFLVVYSH